MKNGVLRPDEGYSILVEDKPRSVFDVVEGVSYAVARNHKKRHSVITIWDRDRDVRIVMLEDGRTMQM